jgi:hypothetical protein
MLAIIYLQYHFITIPIGYAIFPKNDLWELRHFPDFFNLLPFPPFIAFSAIGSSSSGQNLFQNLTILRETVSVLPNAISLIKEDNEYFCKCVTGIIHLSAETGKPILPSRHAAATPSGCFV